MKKTLYRDTDNALVAGVIAGMADYFDQDATLLRILFVVLMIVTALMPCLLGYVLAWVLMPVKPTIEPVAKEDYTVYS